MFRKGLFVAVLMMCATVAHSQETRLAVGAWSKHVPSSDTVTNETHNLVGIEYQSVGAGYFKNSYGRDTFYVGKVWRKQTEENVNFVWSLGANYGYRGCFQSDDGGNASLCPHGYIGIEYTKYRVVPTIKWMPGAFIFSPEIKF